MARRVARPKRQLLLPIANLIGGNLAYGNANDWVTFATRLGMWEARPPMISC